MPINLESIQPFIGVPVELIIQDAQGGDQAHAVKKTVKKAQHCPDGTHIRLYFDDFYFLAVPLESTLTANETEWSAFDMESGLTYIIKKVQVF